MENGIPMSREVEAWLKGYIAGFAAADAYEYVDNVRYAHSGSRKQCAEYEDTKSRGCCGFYDSEVTCPIDCQVYLVGFNYGH